MHPIRRRALLLATAGAAITAGCGWPRDPPGGSARRGVGTGDGGPARLEARPGRGAVASPDPARGTRRLDAGSVGPEVLLHVPPGLDDGAPARLVLTLHGAGGDARGGLAPLLPLADANRLLLLAPSAQGATWDAIRGSWGADVEHIDRALAAVFGSYRVDPTHVVVSGFSDGGSYALSLGLANGDLFTHVIAFSPGFVVPAPRVDTPAVFVSHGRDDTVLPIERTTRRIVPRLRESGHPLVVREFDGPHLVPPPIAQDAVRWLLSDQPSG
jgi:phospholipase/carboxylesterase